jgi:hypothetical protein
MADAIISSIGASLGQLMGKGCDLLSMALMSAADAVISWI